MKVKVIKNVTLEDGMSWDDEGLIRMTRTVRDAAVRDYFKLLKELKQDPVWWTHEYEEEIDEVLGLGTITIKGEGI